jgi:hypothetical protein
MGRRARARGALPVQPAPARPVPPPRAGATPSRRARRDEAPPAPWGAFPLAELAVLLGLVLMAVGFFVVSGGARAGLIAAGVMTASLAGLEVALREHLAGYRSHSTLLAGVAALAVAVPLNLAGLAPLPALAAGVLAGGLVFWRARVRFARRAGGLRFRA